MFVRTYPIDDYAFDEHVRSVLKTPDLAMLHETLPIGRDRDSDQDSSAHWQFYDAFADMADDYARFLRREILPLFTEPLCVQRVPTFRVSQPGGTAVAAYHRDLDYNHQRGTVNFWLPLTDAFGTNTVWVESAPDRGDFQPVVLRPGQFLQFDAINLRHGNQTNETGRTRVSFDFRVIPLSQYNPVGLCTVTNKVPLEIGGYYVVLDAEQDADEPDFRPGNGNEKGRRR